MKRFPKRTKCVAIKNLPVISLSEAARQTHYDPSTLRAKLIKKQIFGYKHAGKWWIYTYSLEALKILQKQRESK